MTPSEDAAEAQTLHSAAAAAIPAVCSAIAAVSALTAQFSVAAPTGLPAALIAGAGERTDPPVSPMLAFREILVIK